MWPSIFAIFELTPPSNELLLKWTETLLFGEMSSVSKSLWELLDGSSTYRKPSNKYGEYDRWQRTDAKETLQYFLECCQKKNPAFVRNDFDDHIDIYAGSYELRIYYNGIAYIDYLPFNIPLDFEEGWKTAGVREKYYALIFELIDYLQPKNTNKSVVFSTNFSEYHLDIIDEKETWYTPFSIKEHIKDLRNRYPQNERPLDHDFSEDWDSHFFYSDEPFFMVRES